tara:strand:+ start:1419 stop:1577 length:159 start_codon:yes stop_codon:yes gene_type:complete
MRKIKELIDPEILDKQSEPTKEDTRPGWKKLFDRMKRVDPKQSEKYKQRTGE